VVQSPQGLAMYSALTGQLESGHSFGTVNVFGCTSFLVWSGFAQEGCCGNGNELRNLKMALPRSPDCCVGRSHISGSGRSRTGKRSEPICG